MLVFFTFSTTQEYYSMPCYPALALLLGSAMAAGGDWVRRGTRVLAVVARVRGRGAASLILVAVRNVPAPGDISQALSQHPGAYTLSLGHMEDLTLESFAYLRLPLAMAAVAFLIGALGSAARDGPARVPGRGVDDGAVLPRRPRWPWWRSTRISRRVRWRRRCCARPQGELVVDHHYYTFSSVFFYTEPHRVAAERPLQQPGVRIVRAGRAGRVPRRRAMEGACGSGRSAITWSPKTTELPRFEKLVGKSALFVLAESGGKVVLTNQPVDRSLRRGSDRCRIPSRERPSALVCSAV